MQKWGITKTVLLVATIIITTDSTAQNVGIGTNEPIEKLQVNGNLLIQQPYTFTNTAPTVAQTKTMVNGSTVTFLSTDSTGRIFDPGGPVGNYLDNLTSTATIPCCAPYNYGIEVNIEDINLNTLDSVIITDQAGTIVFKVGNGYNTNSKTIYNTRSLTITFKSNNDGQTGRGFDILFKRLYIVNNTPGSNSAFGNALYFDAVNGIFRSGYLSDAQKGIYSTAMGFLTKASGNYSSAIGNSADASGTFSTAMGSSAHARGSSSTAMGNGTDANGSYSTAMGHLTEASGNNSTAMGFLTQASGDNSTAMGKWSVASGNFSTVLGYRSAASGDTSIAMGDSCTASGDVSLATGKRTTASGSFSTAMGNFVSTNNHPGSFIIGDNSTRTIMNIIADNSFRARFANGYRLYTNSTGSIGARLDADDNSWSIISDVYKKENFEPVNGEEFLQKISSFKLSSWNYKGQDSKIHRHYGPMAQDFHAAFGKDKYGAIGNDTTINQADFDGVNLIAIQALIRRTESLSKENEILKQELAAVKKRLDAADGDEKSVVSDSKRK